MEKPFMYDLGHDDERAEPMENVFQYPSLAETHPPRFPRFGNVFDRSRLHYEDIDRIAELAGVSRNQVVEMMRGGPIARSRAQQILDVFKHMLGKQGPAKYVTLDYLDLKFPDEPLARENSHA